MLCLFCVFLIKGSLWGSMARNTCVGFSYFYFWSSRASFCYLKLHHVLLLFFTFAQTCILCESTYHSYYFACPIKFVWVEFHDKIKFDILSLNLYYMNVSKIYSAKINFLQWRENPRPPCCCYSDAFLSVLSWNFGCHSESFNTMCSNDSRNDPNPKSEMVHHRNLQLNIPWVAHVWLAHLDRHQTSKPVIIGVAGSIPAGGSFFAETF